MLKELSIKNFAIIDDLKIEFTEGLNLLTGETGSGKSIIIEALGVVLGGRTSKDLIRTGEDRAIIEALFFINDDIKLILSQLGYEDPEMLIITREISKNYPSISRINGRPVTINILQSITSRLVDIFGQHEHQSLLNISNHIILIDSFGDKSHHNLMTKIGTSYDKYKDEKIRLKEMNISSHERERELDLLKFQIDEIEEAKLTLKDDEDIENSFKKLSNMKEIIQGLSQAVEILNNSGFENSSVLELVDRTTNIISALYRFDKSLEPFLKRTSSIRYELQDLAIEMSHYLENLDIDEERLDFLEDRMDLINRLKKKYGSTIGKIHEYRDKIILQYEGLVNFEKEIEKINKLIEGYEMELKDNSRLLSDKRKNIALDLEKKIGLELKELNMDNVLFKVKFEDKKELSPNGMDTIEFLISTNPGEELKAFSKIVSGGEMSRIMLGFKSILAHKDKIPTLIFDEIDTGISGRTAQIVGEKIKKISRNHQVLSISHLPQIAALADSHFVISKDVGDQKSITKIERLDDEKRILEMARLLGGVHVTETTLNHAREMLEMSKGIKN